MMWHGGVATSITGVLECVVQLSEDKHSVDAWMCCAPGELAVALEFARVVIEGRRDIWWQVCVSCL